MVSPDRRRVINVVGRLVTKAKMPIPLLNAVIDARVAEHKLTPTCGATLTMFLALAQRLNLHVGCSWVTRAERYGRYRKRTTRAAPETRP